MPEDKCSASNNLFCYLLCRSLDWLYVQLSWKRLTIEKLLTREPKKRSVSEEWKKRFERESSVVDYGGYYEINESNAGLSSIFCSNCEMKHTISSAKARVKRKAAFGERLVLENKYSAIIIER